MRAAHLDEAESHALHRAVVVSRPRGAQDGRKTPEPPSLADASVTSSDAAPDDLDLSLEESQDEIDPPAPEAFPGTELVDDLEAARLAARRRLETDRLHTSARTRVLSAEEEVGLCLLFRGAMEPSEPLPHGYTASLSDTDDAHKAFSAMVHHNQGLVHSIAQVLSRRSNSLPYEDLVQHGNIGLMRAVEKFDVSLGYKFSTYATWWIRQYASRGVMNEGTLIRIPVHMWENVEKVRKAKREFVGSGRKPRSDDLALASGLKRKRVEECLWILGGMTVSFEHPIGEGATLGDVVGDVLPSAPGPEQALWAALAREELLGLIDACEFKDRDREILFLRFGFADGVPWILEEIGKRFGLTRERIRQIEKRALEASGSKQQRTLTTAGGSPGRG